MKSTGEHTHTHMQINSDTDVAAGIVEDGKSSTVDEAEKDMNAAILRELVPSLSEPAITVKVLITYYLSSILSSLYLSDMLFLSSFDDSLSLSSVLLKR